MESLMKILQSLSKRKQDSKERHLFPEQLRLLLAGPLKSGRSSVLFELAFSHAETGKMVLFISPRKISRLPLLFSNRDQPSLQALSKINMIYLEEKNHFVEFMASVHVKYKDPIDLIIVDDIDHYYMQGDKRNQLISQAKVLSFFADAGFYLNVLGKQHPPKAHCDLICVVATPDNGKMSNNQKDVLDHWFQDIIIIKKQKDSSYKLSAIMETTRDKLEQSDALSFNYSFENQKIIASTDIQ